MAPVCALAILTTLGGCSIFKGGDDKKPRTPVMGQRISVLAAESGAEIDPALDAVPVVVPPEQVNPDWGQPGGNAAKSMGNPALGQALAVAWIARSPDRPPRRAWARGLWSAAGESMLWISMPSSTRSI